MSSYGSAIPIEAKQAWERVIVNYDEKQRDGMIARSLATMRNVGATVDTDTVTFVEGSGGNATIAAKVTAKGAIPEVTGIKTKDIDHKMFQLALGFYVNGRDLQAKPELKTRSVEWCTKNIRRLEDYMWMNGDTTLNLTGLDTAAGLNVNGKVVAASASGNDVNNVGAWDGSDDYIDLYTDILEAVSRLDDDFEPAYLLGRRIDLAPVRKMDDMRKKYIDDILDLFAAGSAADFMRYSLYVPSGYVYVVAKDMDFCEMVVSEDLIVDADYPKEKGNNLYVELREWLNPNEFHSNEGVVEIATA